MVLRREVLLLESDVQRQHHLEQVAPIAGKCEHEKAPFACGLTFAQGGLSCTRRQASRAAPWLPGLTLDAGPEGHAQRGG